MKKQRFYKKYSSQKRLGDVQGFNFGVGLLAPPVMTAWCYYIDGLLIDTGISLLRKKAVEMISAFNPDQIVLTHHHEDHSGNACAISSKLEIPVYGHAYARQKLSTPYPIKPYQHLLWGKSQPLMVNLLPETIETKNYSFLPVHTPGHSKDHTVYIEKNRGWLFSGDLFLGTRIKYFRKDEVISDQIDSLKKLLFYDFDTLYCAHNPHLTGGKKRIREKLDFLENFSGTVYELYQKGYSEKAIINCLDNGSDMFIKIITVKNASYANMVKSALKAITG